MKLNVEFIPKGDPYVIKLVFGIPLMCLVGYMIYSFLTSDNIANLIKQDNLAENFEGKVDILFKDEGNHNIKTAILSNDYKYLLPPPWEEIIKVGDSLSKKKNTLKLEVYRNGHPKFVLDYQDTYKRN